MSMLVETLDPVTLTDIYEVIEKYQWLKKSSSKLAELWELCDERSQQLLIKELLSNFKYVDTYELEETCLLIVNHIECLDFKSSNTIICAISDTDEVDGSHSGLQFMKNKFSSHDGWSSRNLFPTIVKAAHELEDNQNIVLFDDFIGTGDTMIKKITYMQGVHDTRGIKSKSLAVVAFAGMKFGVENIKSAFDIDVYSPILLEKGITHYNETAIAKQKIQLMKALESKFQKKFKKLKLEEHSLGYKGSETLFQIQGYNCPNNLFPIFWWPTMKGGKPRLTIFNRLR